MGSNLNYITLEPSILGVALHILVYLSVYTYFLLCHRLAYQFFPWLVDVNGVLSLLRIRGQCQSSYKEHGFRPLGSFTHPKANWCLQVEFVWSHQRIMWLSIASL
jgi:hypothetical protein